MNTIFDTDQKAVVESTAKKIVCLAGPGSGKTTTLVGRINHLIDIMGVDPAGIVTITFTNRAASILRGKLGRPVGFVGTIHSFCYSLIRAHIGELTIIDDDMREELIVQTMEEQRYRGTRKLIDAAFKSRDKSNLVLTGYLRKLDENGMVDFDEMLFIGLLLCKTKKLPFTDLLVDEVQDASDGFKNIFDSLQCERKFYVGDMRQAIYSFLGGNVNNIIQATNDAACHELPRNYRCAEKICAAANRLLDGAGCSQTVSVTGEPGRVIVTGCKNEADEVSRIVRTIRWQQESQARPGTMAVLLRTNAMVDSYAKQIEGYGLNLIKNKITQHPPDWPMVKLLLTLFANPDNEIIGRKYMRVIKPKDADQAIQNATLQMRGLNELYFHLQAGITAVGAVSKINASQESQDKLNAAMKTLPDNAVVGDLLIALSETQEELTGHGVRVMTLHAAKGSEFDSVFIAGCEQGILPHGRSLKNSELLAEERRLLFVGMTRARSNLFLTWCAERENAWTHKPEPKQPSQFLKEAVLI